MLQNVTECYRMHSMHCLTEHGQAERCRPNMAIPNGAGALLQRLRTETYGLAAQRSAQLQTECTHKVSERTVAGHIWRSYSWRAYTVAECTKLQTHSCKQIVCTCSAWVLACAAWRPAALSNAVLGPTVLSTVALSTECGPAHRWIVPSLSLNGTFVKCTPPSNVSKSN